MFHGENKPTPVHRSLWPGKPYEFILRAIFNNFDFQVYLLATS